MKTEQLIKTCKKIKDKIKNIMEWKYLIYIIMFICISVFCVSIFFNKYNLALISMMIIFIYNVLWSIVDIKKRFIFLLMNLMLFTFVLSRPFISMLRGDKWWYFTKITIQKSLISIFITQIFLLIGNKIGEFGCNQKFIINEGKNKVSTSKFIERTILIILFFTAICSAYVEFGNYINMKNLDYSLIYTNKSIEFPMAIRILSTLFSYAVFAYLATLPKKKFSIIVLIIYTLLGIPSFLLGSRNSLILRVLFSVVYIIIRSIMNVKENWITNKMKILAVIMIPIMIIFLGAYNYIRSDEKIKSINPISLAVDFFYKQGTTFDTICQGFENEKKFKNQPNVISYTFGDIIDYVKYNTISQKIFETEDLGSGNSLKMVEKSNSLAHRLSYVVLGKKSYLRGHGRGTSYIIENYMDAGMLGVAIYSIVLGIYLFLIVPIIKNKGFISRFIVLTSISQIFLLPRYSASGFISFIVTPQFWLIPILILILKFIERRKINGK